MSGSCSNPIAPATTRLTVTIPAALASGAHQAGEESALIVFLCARALDARGSGRVLISGVKEECEALFCGRQLRRILESREGGRYWTRDRSFLRLHSEARILVSYPGEVLSSAGAVRFPLALLDSRTRRGAALLAAVLAGIDKPRSNQFIGRFAGVDRKTISRWMKDPVIAGSILQRTPAWAMQP